MRTVARARTSVPYDLVVAGGEAFGGQVLHIPVHGTFGTSQTGAHHLRCTVVKVDVDGW